MSRPVVMRQPAYERARLLAEAGVWRVISQPAAVGDEELEVRIMLDEFAMQVIDAVYAMLARGVVAR